ncbi:MAG: CoA-binding protein [Candidatus Thorarchaeota archaeon]|nr:CoA-binding protein [Candidatus Thorarchaeota archaeon]
MSQNEIREVLANYKIVAIVGLSREPSKDSHRVAEYLKKNGFQIVPINPFADEVLGEKSYKSLLDTPIEVQKTIEVVDIFRPAQEALAIVEQAVQLKRLHGKPHVVWMQLGIINEEAADLAKKAGMKVIMDKCMMQEHKCLLSART